MKTGLSIAVLMMAAACGAGAQTIVQGPVTNPNNGHRYLVVQAANWTQMEMFAQSLGGHLATVNEAIEDAWINTNLTSGGNWKVFIGLNDAATEGTYVWADGSASAYRNWANGEPKTDDYALIQPGQGGKWTMVSASFAPYGVIEISGSIKVPGDYATIQAAINAASPGSTIEVMPGRYTGGLVLAKAVKVVSSGGPDVTTIDLAGANAVVFSTGTTPETALEGFTITGCVDFSPITAITGSGSISGRVARCVLTGNTSFAAGAGIYLSYSSGAMTFEDCTISGNSAQVGSAFLCSTAGPTAVLINCLITGNTSAGSAFSCVEIEGGDVTMRNCTIAANNNPSGYGVRSNNAAAVRMYNTIVRDGLLSAGTTPIVAEYCNIKNGWAGVGNFDADPKFLGGGSFGLRGDSPCIDAGNVFEYNGYGLPVDLGGSPRTMNDPNVINSGVGLPPIDIGAYEFQPGNVACPADFNGDGFVNGDDYDSFAEHFEEGC